MRSESPALPFRPLLRAAFATALAAVLVACGSDAGSSTATDAGESEGTGGGKPDSAADAGDVTGAPDSETDSAIDAVADVPLDAITDTTTDVEDDTCPTPPDDLPAVNVTGTGRLLSLGQIEYPGLLPRRVRVYLPVEYDADSSRRFPVLYMHDGQNLFDPAEAAFGMAWEADETLDELTADGRIAPTILVAIDNTAERTPDYTPDGAGSQGDVYADFVVGRLMPIVNREFRTLCGRSNTAVVGSSLGGLISLHFATRYPGVFGRVGAVSPSIWWNNRSILDAFDSYPGPLPQRLWIDIGTAEGGSAGEPGLVDAVVDARDLRELALDRGLAWGDSLGYLEVPDGLHNEIAWAYRLDSILWFLLGDDRPDPSEPTDLILSVIGRALSVSDGETETNLTLEGRFGSLRMTPRNEDAVLQSLDPGIATVAADGTVTAVGNGTARIEAAWHGLTAQDTIDVGGATRVAVTFDVTVPSWTPADDTIYLAGSAAELGDWAPDGLALESAGANRWQVEVMMPAGATFEFKVTRGSWATVEKAADGSEISNRMGSADDGATIDVTVETWADD